MAQNAAAARATVITTLRYRDPTAAVRWLCDAFGFERHLVAEGDDGRVTHAQLAFGNGMVMLGPVRDDAYGELIAQPDATGGRETQAAYVIVADADRQYERAKSAGAVIVMPIKDEDYGGRGFSCRDPEGRLWNFGTYDPWAGN